MVSTAVVLAVRLKHASRVMRHILAPVLGASIVRTIALAAFVGSGSPKVVAGVVFASYMGILLAIVVGLTQGRVYDAAALERLVQGLRTRPGPDELRTVMARALDDPTLRVAYWLPEAGSYAGADGLVVSLADKDADRAITYVATADGEPVAALEHDPALLDHPALLDALASTAVLALETNGLEAAVAAERVGTIVAVDDERRRIERDLHDGTQQRLIALRMKLNAAGRIGGSDRGRADAIYTELVGDVDAALEELRAVSHGIAPPILVERGLRDALTAVANNAPVRVRVHAPGITRYEPHVETAVYFCCLEALQNVEKHAGDGVSADVDLTCDGQALSFVVRDDGEGFDPGVGGQRRRAKEHKGTR